MTSPLKGRGRRAVLAQAAVRVTAARGLRGLTHRAVDEEAGVPTGTTSSYLRTRDALIALLADHVGRRLQRDVEEMIERLFQDFGNLSDALDETSALLCSWMEDTELMLVRAELNLEAIRRPEIAKALSGWRIHFHRMATVYTQMAGLDRPAQRAETIIAFVEGLLVVALEVEPERRSGYVRESVGIALEAATPPEAGAVAP